MRRRGLGLGAVQKHQQQQAKFREKSNEIAVEQLAKLSEQMGVFRTNLQEFASKHKKNIRKNPDFRRQFQEMCATAGVDPLQSSANFWTKLLGVGDFYYELGVQIVEVCMATSHRNGGIMGIEELHTKVLASRNVGKTKTSSTNEDVTVDDLLRAIEKLSILGGGLKVISSGKTFIVQSVASELSMDHTMVLEIALKNKGNVSVSSLRKDLNWSEERIKKAINGMIMEGIVWVDEQAPNEIWYWFPGLC